MLVVELLTTLKAGERVIGMETVSVTVAALAEVTVTRLVNEPPASISPWVRVYWAVQVINVPTAREVAGQLGAESTWLSDILIPVTVTLPVLVTLYE